jgi:hypothetical protein
LARLSEVINTNEFEAIQSELTESDLLFTKLTSLLGPNSTQLNYLTEMQIRQQDFKNKLESKLNQISHHFIKVNKSGDYIVINGSIEDSIKLMISVQGMSKYIV